MRLPVLVVVIVLVGAGLRARAAVMLPLDADEPKYLEAASAYAAALRSNELVGVVDYVGNLEHPALPKLLFGAAVAIKGDATEPERAVYPSRAVSVAFSTLALLLVALVSPLAAALLAGHTVVVQYSSLAYMEAIPLAASVAAVLAFRRSDDPRDRWFWLSATALGLTAAGKFTYLLPIIVTILYVAVAEHGPRWRASSADGDNSLPWRPFCPTSWWSPHAPSSLH